MRGYIYMSQEENKQNIIRFDNAQELMDYIGVSRATLYRRMNAYNIKSSKRSFTQDELDSLKEQPERQVKQTENKINNDMIQNALRANENLLNELKQNYDTQIQQKDKELSYKQLEIDKQAKQIETSDKQISELHKLLDQQQKLSAQLKLQLEEVSESKKGFWNRIFNK